jgi:hypothetical protein
MLGSAADTGRKGSTWAHAAAMEEHHMHPQTPNGQRVGRMAEDAPLALCQKKDRFAAL